MNTSVSVERVGLGRYMLWFAGVYLGLGIVVAVAVNLLGIKTNSGMMGFVVLIASANAAGRMFIKDHKRLFTSAERMSMTFYSFIITLVLTVIGIVISIAVNDLGGSGPLPSSLDRDAMIGLSVGGTVIALLLFGVLYLSYGHLMKMIFNGMQKRGEV